MIRISVKGLAKFMRKGPAGQRTVLRDFKFPRGAEARAQTVYYAEARRGIREYHMSDNNPAGLVKSVDDLRKKAERVTGKAKTRFEHNIRAMQSYLQYFSANRFEVLVPPKLEYSYHSVVVGATPDLFVRDGTNKKLIKLDLGVEPADEEMIKVILQVIFEAAQNTGMNLLPNNVIYLDISRGLQHVGARSRTKLTRDIQAACENIEAMWDGIKKN